VHVLFLPSWYPDADRPIAGIFFRDLALAMRRQGHKVGVVAAPSARSLRRLGRVRRPSDLRSATTTEDDEGVATYRVLTWNWLPVGRAPRGATWLALLAGARLVDRYVRDHGRPDLIHAQGVLLGGCLAVRAGRRHGVPVLIAEHSSAFLRGMIGPRQASLAGDAFAQADALAAVSAALRDAMAVHAPGRQIEVVGNFVDTSYFAPAETAPACPPFLVCSVGFLRPVKGFDVLVEGFAAGLRGRQARLTIAGDGPELPRLAAAVRALGVADSVDFPGALDRQGVRELLRSSHAFALASHAETFGVALVEAMACGLPVAATRCGGPEDIVEPSSGLLVPPGDAKALGQALLSLMDGRGRYDAETIRRRCWERFGEPAIVGRLSDIYEDVLRAHGAAGPEARRPR
jgi:glycosyltransferase involved in cell wall biosynthesis